MEKVIRDGRVAVIISPGFGAGWSTWNNDSIAEVLLFHPKIVEMVEQNRISEITDNWLRINCDISIDYICTLADSLQIEWMPIGTPFIVEEYDGSESIRTLDDLPFVA